MCKYICIHYPHNLMYIYVYTYIYTYVYVHTHMIYLCVCTLMCIYAYSVLTTWYISIYVYIYIYIYTYIYTYISVQTRMIYVNVCTLMCMYMPKQSSIFDCFSPQLRNHNPTPPPTPTHFCSGSHYVFVWRHWSIESVSIHRGCLYRYTVISACI